MRQARPFVSILVALASGTAGMLLGMLLGMRDTHPLLFLQVLFTWGLAGQITGMAVGAIGYIALLRYTSSR